MERKFSVNSDVSETATKEAPSNTSTLSSVSRSREHRRAKGKAKPRSRYQVRQLKSKGALQVLLWNLLVFSYQNTAFVNILTFFYMNEPWKYVLATIFLQEVLPKLFYPVAGWIADAKVGRYKVIRASLVFMWIGSVILLFLSLLRYSVTYSPDNIPDNVNNRYQIVSKATLPFAIIVYILNAIGNAGFHANVIPFGLDQMEDGSAEQHSAFIHWYYWTRNFSFGILVNLCVHANTNYCKAAFSFGPNRTPDAFSSEAHFRLNFVLLVCECAFLAAALCVDFIFSPKWLNKDPKTHYPLRRIWRISNFVRKNKQLVGRRKAITFTYDAPPDRWDFAKRLYGGPFDGEDVEDVRTFWRVLVFISSIGLGGMVLIYQVNSVLVSLYNTYDCLIMQGYFLYGPFVRHMKLPTILHHCISEFAVSSLTGYFTIVLVIPIYEFIVYPFFRRYVLRILRRIGLGMAMALAGTIGILLMDFLGHRYGNNNEHNQHCMLFTTDFEGKTPAALHFTPGYFIPLIFVISLGEIFIFVPSKLIICHTSYLQVCMLACLPPDAAFEFICAQSPYSMRGMLIGLFYAILAVFVSLIGLVVGIVVAIFNNHKDDLLHELSCGSWYLVTSVGIGIVGFLLYLIAAKCYKKRERGGYQVNEQTVLEGYYEPRDDEAT